MNAALLVPRVAADPAANLAALERKIAEAAALGADIVVAPEAVLTGLINNDDPAHDLPLGQPIPGPATTALGVCCRRHRMWLAFGLLERDGDKLYDSAVLIDSEGSIRLKYRRNQPQWHGRNADPTVYREGDRIDAVTTPFGVMAFLICGDLFDDGILARFRALRADWLLFPFARCFPDGSADPERWDREELPQYLARVRLAAAPALMVNYLASPTLPNDHSFGGAFHVSAQGQLLAALPLGEEGVLVLDA